MTRLCVQLNDLLDELLMFIFKQMNNVEVLYSLVKLVLINHEPQQHKQSYKSTNDNYHLSIVEYSHYIELNIERVHDHYVEEFLCDTKTCFRKNIRLLVVGEALLRVTNHFTRKDTQMNCTKVDNLLPWSEWRSSKSFQEYFPSIKKNDYICSFFK